MEKKKIIIPVVTIAVIGAVGGTGYYYRDNVIDVATEAFDVVAEKIPFLQSGKSDDKVYVEKVSKIMNTYTGNTNRYNGVVESQDSYEVNVDSSRTIKEILVKVGDEVEEGQTLVTYDTSELEMQVKQAKLELEGFSRRKIPSRRINLILRARTLKYQNMKTRSMHRLLSAKNPAW